ncbi:hypothetical protein CHS0354_023825 [Potamilus streckersoni]|uniref:Nondiscriminating glutamyl-tRNA synthetase EARS2, mitochondrial n=1 Tax=Potamilus streckersoni TaxID=2493646 RepID=A0AAE0VLS1_9BIVA|nr:hypothetical protein CHS0354_023825 [Potamilus streckersoni]
MTKIRTRFAPSPTGHLHIGGLRTALYNYLFAKRNNGDFVLRIEDTDQARLMPDAIEMILQTLTWAGLDPDESFDKPGKYGPYIQSQRLDIYKKYCDVLIKEGKAYYCFSTSDELEESRKLQQKQGLQPKYNRKWLPEYMGGDMPQSKIKDALDRGQPKVVRMKIPEKEMISFNDVVRGRVEFDSSVIDDQILLKADGFPTYHLAVVVDDYLMEISHVIRGEEWLSSTPKHVLLYNFFGWDLPVFAHAPLLLNPDRTKLSKRQGDVSVEDYIKKGFSSEALLNFVALLGWNEGSGTEQEIYTMQELVNKFSLERIGRSGAVFNVEKLSWVEKSHIRLATDGDIAKKILIHLKPLIGTRPSLLSDEVIQSSEYLCSVAALMKERVDFFSEFVTFSSYFFFEPDHYDEEGIRKRWTAATNDTLLCFADRLKNLNLFDVGNIEDSLKLVAEEKNVKTAALVHPVRIAVTGVTFGPSLYHILELIGQDVSVKRLHNAVKAINFKLDEVNY